MLLFVGSLFDTQIWAGNCRISE